MRRENLVMILLHYFVNLFMLGPLFVTGDFWKPAKSDLAFLFSGKCVHEAPGEHQRWVEHLRQGEGGGLYAHHHGVGHALDHPPCLHPWHPPCFCLSEVSPPVEKNPRGKKQHLRMEPSALTLSEKMNCVSRKIFVKGQVNYNHLLLNKRSPEHHLLWIQKWKALSPKGFSPTFANFGDFWCCIIGLWIGSPKSERPLFVANNPQLWWIGHRSMWITMSQGFGDWC